MNLQDWIKEQSTLEESLIITDNAKNVNALIRKINATGKAICSLVAKRLVDIAKEILFANAAQENTFKKFEPMTDDIGAFILEGIICNAPAKYDFVPQSSMCHRTALEILANINLIRKNKLTVESTKAPNKKLAQLLLLVEEYENTLAENDLYDDVRFLQEAIAVLQNTDGLYSIYDCGLMYGDKLTCLEKEFLDLYVKEVAVLTYDFEQEAVQWSFFKGYGTFNEVDHVVADIINKGIPLGKVSLIYTSAEYETLIAGACAQKNMPVRFVSGRSANGLDYIRLLQAILDWADNNYAYESLKPVFLNKLVMLTITDNEGNTQNLNTLKEYLAGINEGIGWGLNRYADFVTLYNAKLASGEKHSKLHPVFVEALGKLSGIFVKLEATASQDKIVLADMLEELEAFADYITVKKNKEKQSIKKALKTEINCLKFRPNVATLTEALQILREDLDRLTFSEEEAPFAISAIMAGGRNIIERPYVYVIGLSDKHFKQSVTESPVLSDEEREKYFDLTKGNVLLAKDRPSKRQDDFIFTLTSVENGAINIGYSGFDTIKLEPCSPSALYLNLLDEHEVSKKAISAVEYQNIVAEKTIVKSADVWESTPKEAEAEAEPKQNITVRLSASGLDGLYNCPLSYHYCYEQKIPKEEYQEQVTGKWLNAAERGTFVHKVLQDYVTNNFMGNAPITSQVQRADFDAIFTTVKEAFQEICPIDSEAVAKKEMEDIYASLLIYLEKLHKEFAQADNKWKVEGCEIAFGPSYDKSFGKGYTYQDNSTLNINFSGCVDRLDSYVDEKGTKHYRIVDYKSSHKNTFKNYKLKGTTQHHIYAMFAGQDGIVDEFVYVFPLMEDAEDMELKVTNFTDPCMDGTTPKEVLHQVFFNQHYELPEKADSCKFCNYVDICYRNTL